MSVNVKFSAVEAAISGLSISGIKIASIGAIPGNCELLTPILIPNPDNFITNLQPVLPKTYGTAGIEKLDLEYNMNYRYLHAAAGANINFGAYSGLITNIATILQVFLTNDTVNKAVDLRVNTISNIVLLTDPAGNYYHGCDIVLSIVEYCEVA